MMKSRLFLFTVVSVFVSGFVLRLDHYKTVQAQTQTYT